MKTVLILGFLLAVTTVSVSAQTFTAPAKSQQIQRKKTPAHISHREVTGVIPRAVRGGNPLQMLNPRAPIRYGTAQQSVVYDGYYPRRTVMSDPSYPGKWRGIKFFTFLF